MSVKYPCTNQCNRPSVDLKDTFPLIGEKEIQVSRVADLLVVFSQSQNPSVSFNPAVFKKSFGIGNLSHISGAILLCWLDQNKKCGLSTTH